MKHHAMTGLLSLLLCTGPALAVDAARVPAHKHTVAGLYADATEAYALKQKLGREAFFVDIRSRAEVAWLGTPTVADAQVPFADHPAGMPWDDAGGRFKLAPNAGFEPELARRLAASGLGKDATIILMCRSGDRSTRAADLLTGLGYRNVYSVVDGFEGDVAKDGPQAGQRVVNGWKNAGLPWTYQLDSRKLFGPSR